MNDDAPDRNCITLADGNCISEIPCMHDSAPHRGKDVLFPRLVVVKDKRPTHQVKPWRVLIVRSRKVWDYRLVSRHFAHPQALLRGLYELKYEINAIKQHYEAQLALEDENRLALNEWGWRE